MSRTSRPSRSSHSLLLLATVCASVACKPRDENSPASATFATGDVAPNAGEVLITILGTNDIHGGLEGEEVGGVMTGGLPYWAGVAAAIRAGNEASFPGQAVTLILDGGDQFQGTLLSNFNEGRAMFEAFQEIGYDAVVPGNHDFDFGPEGWLDDVILPTTPPSLADRRGALKAALKAAPLPMVSANTYLKESVASGPVKSAGCVPESGAAVDWANAQRPDFVQPFVLKEVNGIRFAIVGLDNEKTAETTMAPNVSDLCFRDLFETYTEVRAALADQADVFLITTHEGNLASSSGFKNALNDYLAGHQGAIDAVVTGHSHQVERYFAQGVPVIQSGSGGSKYGRIDLIYDRQTKKIDVARTKSKAGIALRHDTEAESGDRIEPSARVQAIVTAARSEAAALASRKIGNAPAEVKRSRKEDSPLANALTDQLRLATGADVVFINSATIRDTLPKGNLTYEHLYKVLPFSSRTIRLKPINADTLVRLAKIAVSESGEYGILCFSGMTVAFTGSGNAAKLQTVTLASGKVLFDDAQGGLLQVADRFTVLALDFIVDKVSGVHVLNEVPQDKDIGVFREIVADRLIAQPVAFPTSVDGRVKKL